MGSTRHCPKNISPPWSVGVPWLLRWWTLVASSQMGCESLVLLSPSSRNSATTTTLATTVKTSPLSSKRSRALRLFANQQQQDDDGDNSKETPAVVVRSDDNKDTPKTKILPNNKEDDKDDAPFPFPTTENMTELLPPRWKLVVGYLTFISFWPFLAWLQLYLHSHEFDIDTYMTVKGLLDTAADSVNDNDMNDMESILELPPLSPAERLVDSLFGPPNVDRRGF
eukprot:scaffold15108_cov180-Amphora_coffeaeformis.AAC.12